MRKSQLTDFAVIVSIALILSSWFCCSRSGKTKDKRNIQECYDFADKHWDEEAYREWWETLPDTVRDNYVGTLPDEHNQQYYDMIGKHPDQFGWAWEDFDGVDSLTPYNSWYLDCLEEAQAIPKFPPTRSQQ